MPIKNPRETVKINVPAQFPIQVFGQVYVVDRGAVDSVCSRLFNL